MAYKPYLCISCSLTPGVKRWIRTFKSSGVSSQVRLLVFMWEPYFENELREILTESDDDFQVFPQAGAYPGTVASMRPLMEHLKEKNYSPCERFIWVDCHDVGFQKKLPCLGDANTIVVCSEYAVHGDSKDFWVPIIRDGEDRSFDFLLDKTIYNGGCFVMPAYLLLDYCEGLFGYTGCHGSVKGIRYMGNQLFFNKWLQSRYSLCQAVPSLFLALCSGYFTIGYTDCGVRRRGLSGYSYLGRSGIFSTPDGEPFSIVHANGPTKTFLDFLYEE